MPLKCGINIDKEYNANERRKGNAPSRFLIRAMGFGPDDQPVKVESADFPPGSPIDIIDKAPRFDPKDTRPFMAEIARANKLLLARFKAELDQCRKGSYGKTLGDIKVHDPGHDRGKRNEAQAKRDYLGRISVWVKKLKEEPNYLLSFAQQHHESRFAITRDPGSVSHSEFAEICKSKTTQHRRKESDSSFQWSYCGTAPQIASLDGYPLRGKEVISQGYSSFCYPNFKKEIEINGYNTATLDMLGQRTYDQIYNTIIGLNDLRRKEGKTQGLYSLNPPGAFVRGLDDSQKNHVRAIIKNAYRQAIKKACAKDHQIANKIEFTAHSLSINPGTVTFLAGKSLEVHESRGDFYKIGQECSRKKVAFQVPLMGEPDGAIGNMGSDDAGNNAMDEDAARKFGLSHCIKGAQEMRKHLELSRESSKPTAPSSIPDYVMSDDAATKKLISQRIAKTLAEKTKTAYQARFGKDGKGNGNGSQQYWLQDFETLGKEAVHGSWDLGAFPCFNHKYRAQYLHVPKQNRSDIAIILRTEPDFKDFKEHNQAFLFKYFDSIRYFTNKGLLDPGKFSTDRLLRAFESMHLMRIDINSDIAVNAVTTAIKRCPELEQRIHDDKNYRHRREYLPKALQQTIDRERSKVGPVIATSSNTRSTVSVSGAGGAAPKTGLGGLPRRADASGKTAMRKTASSLDAKATAIASNIIGQQRTWLQNPVSKKAFPDSGHPIKGDILGNNSHFDWWIFPTQTSDERYNITHNIRQLVYTKLWENDGFRNNYLKCLSDYASSLKHFVDNGCKAATLKDFSSGFNVARILKVIATIEGIGFEKVSRYPKGDRAITDLCTAWNALSMKNRDNFNKIILDDRVLKNHDTKYLEFVDKFNTHARGKEAATKGVSSPAAPASGKTYGSAPPPQVFTTADLIKYDTRNPHRAATLAEWEESRRKAPPPPDPDQELMGKYQTSNPYRAQTLEEWQKIGGQDLKTGFDQGKQNVTIPADFLEFAYKNYEESIIKNQKETFYSQYGEQEYKLPKGGIESHFYSTLKDHQNQLFQPLGITKQISTAYQKDQQVGHGQLKVSFTPKPIFQKETRPGKAVIDVNFANQTNLGGDCMRHDSAQEEKMAASSPAIMALAFMQQGKNKDHFFNLSPENHFPPKDANGKYLPPLTTGGDAILYKNIPVINDDGSTHVTNQLAIAAHATRGDEYSDSLDTARYHYQTALGGFTLANKQTEGDVVIRSGLWGSGAFGNSRYLMMAVQILAARDAGVELELCNTREFDKPDNKDSHYVDDFENNFHRIIEKITQDQQLQTIDEQIQAVYHLCQTKDKKPPEIPHQISGRAAFNAKPEAISTKIQTAIANAQLPPQIPVGPSVGQKARPVAAKEAVTAERQAEIAAAQKAAAQQATLAAQAERAALEKQQAEAKAAVQQQQAELLATQKAAVAEQQRQQQANQRAQPPRSPSSSVAQASAVSATEEKQVDHALKESIARYLDPTLPKPRDRTVDEKPHKIFDKTIESQNDKPKPTQAYKGCGMKATFDDQGRFVIDEIFRNEVPTFQFKQGGKDYALGKNNWLKGKVIAKIWIGTEGSGSFKTPTEIIAEQIAIDEEHGIKAGLAIIATAFHGPEEVKFNIEHGTDELNFTCNQKDVFVTQDCASAQLGLNSKIGDKYDPKTHGTKAIDPEGDALGIIQQQLGEDAQVRQ